MYFEIVGDITHAETFAIGTSIREVARLRKRYAEVGGESARVLLASAWKTALSDKPRYTGTRRTGSGAEISRSSISLTDAYAIDSETVRRLPRK